MSAKKKDAFSEAVVGVFMLAVLSLLVYFTVVISGVDVLHGRRKALASATFSDVGGLKEHDNVMYRGTKVGTVKAIDLTPSNLVVRLEIDGDVVLRETCRIAVCNLSMLGGNYLLLEEGTGAPQPLETTVFAGEPPTDWMRDVSRIAKNLNDFTSGDELKSIVSNLQVSSEKVRLLTERIERGEGLIGKLLSADETLYDDIRAVATDVRDLSARLRRGEGSLGKLLSADDKLYDDFAATVANANLVSECLKNGEGLAGRLLKEGDPLYANLDGALTSFRKACDSLDAKETLAGANELLANLNAVAERLKRGEGTIGRLLADDELYREIDGLAKDVRQVLDNFRDTTPISTFGSLVTGGL